MRFTRTLLALTLGAALAACSGGEEASYTDSADALDAGNRAQADKDYPAAISAYEHVVDDPAASEDMRFDALVGLIKAQARINDPGAEANFVSLLADHPDRLEPEILNRIGNSFIFGGNLDQADAVAEAGNERFPESTLWTKLSEGVQMKRDGVSNEELSQLGYTD